MASKIASRKFLHTMDPEIPNDGYCPTKSTIESYGTIAIVGAGAGNLSNNQLICEENCVIKSLLFEISNPPFWNAGNRDGCRLFFYGNSPSFSIPIEISNGIEMQSDKVFSIPKTVVEWRNLYKKFDINRTTSYGFFFRLEYNALQYNLTPGCAEQLLNSIEQLSRGINVGTLVLPVINITCINNTPIPMEMNSMSLTFNDATIPGAWQLYGNKNYEIANSTIEGKIISISPEGSAYFGPNNQPVLYGDSNSTPSSGGRFIYGIKVDGVWASQWKGIDYSNGENKTITVSFELNNAPIIPPTPTPTPTTIPTKVYIDKLGASFIPRLNDMNGNVTISKLVIPDLSLEYNFYDMYVNERDADYGAGTCEKTNCGHSNVVNVNSSDINNSYDAELYLSVDTMMGFDNLSITYETEDDSGTIMPLSMVSDNGYDVIILLYNFTLQSEMHIINISVDEI